MLRLDSLIEIRFGDLEKGAVTQGPDGKDERLAGQHGQLSNHLARLCYEQTYVFLFINHALINMQAARQHEMKTHVLQYIINKSVVT